MVIRLQSDNTPPSVAVQLLLQYNMQYIYIAAAAPSSSSEHSDININYYREMPEPGKERRKTVAFVLIRSRRTSRRPVKTNRYNLVQIKRELRRFRISLSARESNAKRTPSNIITLRQVCCVYNKYFILQDGTDFHGESRVCTLHTVFHNAFILCNRERRLRENRGPADFSKFRKTLFFFNVFQFIFWAPIKTSGPG